MVENVRDVQLHDENDHRLELVRSIREAPIRKAVLEYLSEFVFASHVHESNFHSLKLVTDTGEYSM